MPCDGISGGVRCRPICVRTKYVLAGLWGAPRLHAAALSSLPACGLVSPADPAISLPYQPDRRLPSSECANAQRKCPEDDSAAPYSVASLSSGHSPLLASSASRHPLPPAGVRAPCGRARPATLPPQRLAVRLLCHSERRGCFRLPRGRCSADALHIKVVTYTL